uniref:Uncharacterized protein n=1 Tax=Anguilla anguilla TaxID=7936 RepID=A0A0E9RG71_ANGAN
MEHSFENRTVLYLNIFLCFVFVISTKTFFFVIYHLSATNVMWVATLGLFHVHKC